MERTGTITQGSGINLGNIFLMLLVGGLVFVGGNYMLHDAGQFGCQHKYRDVINPNFGVNTTFVRVSTCQICSNIEESSATLKDYTRFLRFNK